MEHNRFQKQINFILEADKEKNILRQTHLTNHGRRENDAEHAWHMAIMIYLLREYSNEKFDVAKAMLMALIHDIVEIDAGDTYAYDSKSLETQKQREEAAVDRIFGMLPDDQKQELSDLFKEFEEFKTPEAKFAHAMDNFQPLLLNNSNGGEDWLKHNVCKDQVIARQIQTKLGSEQIWQYTQKIIEENIKKGNIKD